MMSARSGLELTGLHSHQKNMNSHTSLGSQRNSELDDQVEIRCTGARGSTGHETAVGRAPSPDRSRSCHKNASA
jgi:hypothetical protein